MKFFALRSSLFPNILILKIFLFLKSITSNYINTFVGDNPHTDTVQSVSRSPKHLGKSLLNHIIASLNLHLQFCSINLHHIPRLEVDVDVVRVGGVDGVPHHVDHRRPGEQVVVAHVVRMAVG